jgi:ferredoxin-NADP reductase/MOSC domain-containing protein YiiM
MGGQRRESLALSSETVRLRRKSACLSRETTALFDAELQLERGRLAPCSPCSVAKLLSVNVGLPRDIDWRGKTVRTAVWKESVRGRRTARKLNIDGDGQGDLLGHGGEHRAVYVYQIDSYRYWERELHRDSFIYGQFGENLTVAGDGLADEEVCIGDRYRIGSALFEVTQPRVTCYRIGIRMDEPAMASLLTGHGRPGFYCRVLEEGEVGADDEIVKVAEGPERMTVAEVNALLYLPGHPRPKLERALRIPALGSGWQGSFRELLDASGLPITGNPALGHAGPAAAPGFRKLRVAQITRESASVTSFVLEPAKPAPLPAALPGQFVVVRMQAAPEGPPLLRSYSLSNLPGQARYRISVKLEPHGAASLYLHTRVRAGDLLDVSAPRGSFTLGPLERPVVLLSAGVGATPVLAMLHALAKEPGQPKVWWLYGARDATEHPFASESRDVLRAIPDSRSFFVYSRPRAQDQQGRDFDARGHIGAALLDQLGVPRDADFYLCGPASFLRDLTGALVERGTPQQQVHTEVFGPGASQTPGVVGTHARAPHPPAGAPGPGPTVSFTRSGLTVRWDPARRSLLELAEACDVPVRWACRTGVCHSCETGLISGHVTYLPQPLDPPAEGNALTCCSRPAGDDLDLDL